MIHAMLPNNLSAKVCVAPFGNNDNQQEEVLTYPFKLHYKLWQRRAHGDINHLVLLLFNKKEILKNIFRNKNGVKKLIQNSENKKKS